MLLPHPDAQTFVDAFDTPPAAPEPRGQQLHPDLQFLAEAFDPPYPEPLHAAAAPEFPLPGVYDEEPVNMTTPTTMRRAGRAIVLQRPGHSCRPAAVKFRHSSYSQAHRSYNGVGEKNVSTVGPQLLQSKCKLHATQE